MMLMVLVFVIATAVLVGCPEAIEERKFSIIGDWVTDADIPATLRRVEFKQGGKLVLRVPQTGGHYRVAEGTWEQDGDLVDLLLRDGQQQILIELRIVELTESRLCWTHAFVRSDVPPICYRRVGSTPAWIEDPEPQPPPMLVGPAHGGPPAGQSLIASRLVAPRARTP